MNKYAILIILNMPFVIFGLLKAINAFRSGRLTPLSLLLRLAFWVTAGLGIIFAQNIYDFLNRHNLTDTTPLSLADVILVTGVVFCLFLSLRLYSKLEMTERRMTTLHEKLSIELSKRNGEHTSVPKKK